MPTCTCAEDWRAIPKERRVVVEGPGAQTMNGGVVRRDTSKVYVFDRDCPIHGYKEIVSDK